MVVREVGEWGSELNIAKECAVWELSANVESILDHGDRFARTLKTTIHPTADRKLPTRWHVPPLGETLEVDTHMIVVSSPLRQLLPQAYYACAYSLTFITHLIATRANRTPRKASSKAKRPKTKGNSTVSAGQ